MPFLQFRLWIEQVQLARTARHEEKDYVFAVGGNCGCRGEAGLRWALGQWLAFLCQEFCQSDCSQTTRAILQETAAVVIGEDHVIPG